MNETVSEVSVGRFWAPEEDLKYSKSEKLEIEHLVRHILLEHYCIFDDLSFSKFQKFGFECTSAKINDGNIEFDPIFVKELATPRSELSEPWDDRFFGFDRLLQYKMLQITGACLNVSGNVVIEWSLFDCPLCDEDIRFFTEFFTKKSCETVTDLLHFLKKWHTAANCFSISDSELDTIKATFSHHFRRLGKFRIRDRFSMTVDYRQLTYTVQPMWNAYEPFGSIRDLRDYLMSQPNALVEKPAADLPKFMEYLVIDTGDLPVRFDSTDFNWVIMYSCTLALYYKISVQFEGTELDDLRDFLSAYRFRMHTGTVKIHEPRRVRFLDDDRTEQED